MTRREKRLAMSLLAVMLVFGGGVVFHLFVYEPMNEVRTQLDTERDDLIQKQNDLLNEQQRIAGILKINPRLTQWAQLSLPPRDPELKKAKLPPEEQKRKHLANLRVAYEAYLSNLMEAAQFRRGTIKVEVRPSNRGPAAMTRGKEKEPPIEQLTFGVVGEGTMENVARMMRAFHKTPLLHHIRGMTLGLANERNVKNAMPGLLRMDLTIDALIVASGEERTKLQSANLAFQPKVLAEPSRNYLVLDKVNMFTGLKSAPKSTAPATTSRPSEDKVEVLRFVKLTMLAFDDKRNRWEATLYDQAKGGREKLLNTGSRDEFTIADKDDHPILEAKVIQVEEGYLLILAEGKYYRLEIGDMLYPAIQKPLGKSELAKLGITPDTSAAEKAK